MKLRSFRDNVVFQVLQEKQLNIIKQKKSKLQYYAV